MPCYLSEGRVLLKFHGNLCVTLNFYRIHELDLGFSRSNFEIVVFQQGEGQFTWIERDMSWKDVESTVTLNYDLDLRFSRSNFEIATFREWEANWHWMKGMWVDRMCDHFQGQILFSCISVMGRLIDKDGKECESTDQYNIPTLVQIMAYHLLGATPLSEPMLPYCKLDPKEHISVKFYLKFKSFHSRKCTRICRLWNGSHFALTSMCWPYPWPWPWNFQGQFFI